MSTDPSSPGNRPSAMSERAAADGTDEALAARPIGDVETAVNELAIVAVADARGRFTRVNDRFCEISKYTREELLGHGPRIVFGEHSREFRQALREMLQQGKTWKGEIQSRAKDGYPYWVHTTIVPFPGADGKPPHYVAVGADITEHKRLEEELRRSDRLNRDVLDSMLSHIAVLDEQGTITMINEVWRQFALANSDSKGTDILRRVGIGANYLKVCERASATSPEAAAAARGIREVLGGDRAKFSIEYPCHAPNEERWFGMSVTPLLRSGHGAVVAHRDITEQKHAQDTIEQQAALLDQAREAIIVRDLEGRVSFWSKGAERMYEWTSQEVIGRNIATFLYRDDEEYRSAAAAVIQRGEWNGELEQITKSGRSLTAEVRLTLLRNDAGAPRAILAINLDITEKKKLEAQYLRAQRMESIGTLAGGIAHDLNNMLAPILMSVTLLRDKLPGAKDQELLRMLEDGTARGSDLVRQILTFARGFESRQVLVNPKHTIQEVSRILRDTLLQRITVQTDVSNDVWPLLGDPTQLHQVLLNLCVNARDAMPRGGALTIRAENLVLDEQFASAHLGAAPGPYVVISVMDTGTGIPKEIRDKIFDPFFTTKEVGKGTGLGLSTTAGIVESHGGFIDVYSEMGHGTTFRVYLPAEIGEQRPSLAQQIEQLPRGHGELILVADDEASVRNITSMTLESFGYRVVTAADGGEAVGIFVERHMEIDAVITDLMMPYLDGATTMRAIRRLRARVPIIAATGLGTEAQRQTASAAGADYFLQKPFSAETVLRVLHQALEETKDLRQARDEAGEEPS